MKGFKGFLASVGAVALLLLLQTTAFTAEPAVVQPKAGAETIVATVNDQPISRGQLIDRMMKQAGRSILDQLIDMMVVRQAADKAGIKISKEAVQGELDQLKLRFPDENAFQEALKSAGLDTESLKGDIETRLMLEKLAADKLKVSQAEVKAYYETNKQQFTVPEMVKARHILVKTEAEARKALDQIKKGEKKFNELAAEISIDTYSKANGGDLGSFPRGRMVPEFDNAAFALNVGEVSDIVKTDFGYHIIKIDGKDAEHELELANVQANIEQMLIDNKKKEAIPAWLEDARSKARINISL